MGYIANLFKQRKSVSLAGMTDWHSHILPGVDDGVQTMAKSLEILSAYEAMGIREVWLTPHIMEDVPNTTAMLQTRFNELKAAYPGNIKLHLSAENMIDSLFMERMASNELLPIGMNRDKLLIETSYFNPPVDFFEDTIEKIIDAGYVPIIAHPERYGYVRDLREYETWKAMGLKFQLNILSTSGFYGPDAKHKSEALLQRGMYDCIGTDIHSPQQIQALKELRVSPQCAEAIAGVLIP